LLRFIALLTVCAAWSDHVTYKLDVHFSCRTWWEWDYAWLLHCWHCGEG